VALNCLSKSLSKRSYLSCVRLIRLRLCLVGSCLTETGASLVLWLLCLGLFGFVFLQAISYSVAFGVRHRQCTSERKVIIHTISYRSALFSRSNIRLAEGCGEITTCFALLYPQSYFHLFSVYVYLSFVVRLFVARLFVVLKDCSGVCFVFHYILKIKLITKIIATAVTSSIVQMAARYSFSGLIGLGFHRLLIRGVYLSNSRLFPFLLQLPLGFRCVRV